jgi:hypothetical protein
MYSDIIPFEVKQHFGTVPRALVEYVRSGMPDGQVCPYGRAIYAPHIAELAAKVGVTMLIEGRAYNKLPATFFSPVRVDNINTILLHATRMW